MTDSIFKGNFNGKHDETPLDLGISIRWVARHVIQWLKTHGFSILTIPELVRCEAIFIPAKDDCKNAIPKVSLDLKSRGLFTVNGADPRDTGGSGCGLQPWCGADILP